MFSDNTIRRIAKISLWLALAFLAVSVIPAFGETRIIHRGDPAPYDGLLLDEAAAVQAANDVRDKDSYEAQRETLQSEAANLQQQVDELESAVADKDHALELAQQREQLRDEIEGKMKAALEMSEKAGALSQQAAEVSIKAAQASTAALEKMHEKLDAANRRGFWGTILGVIVGLVAHAAIP